MTSDVALPAYRPELFRNREDVLALVDDLIVGVQHAGGGPRTLYVVGGPGLGKSWLAFHLHAAVLQGRPDVYSFLYCLEALRRDPAIAATYFPGQDGWQTLGQSEQKLMEAMLQWTLQQLALAGAAHLKPQPAGEQPSLGELSHWTSIGVRNLMVNKVLVFIFDGVSSISQPLRELLETHLLTPLTQLTNVLLIILGRPPLPLWTAPGLVLATAVHGLPPLPEGNPLLGALLAAYGDPGDAYATFLAELLAEVPEAERAQVMQVVLALSVKDSFRKQELADLWSAYQGAEIAGDTGSSSAVTNAIMTPLLAYEIARWRDGAYRIDPQLREAAVGYLIHKDPAAWQRLSIAVNYS